MGPCWILFWSHQILNMTINISSYIVHLLLTPHLEFVCPKIGKFWSILNTNWSGFYTHFFYFLLTSINLSVPQILREKMALLPSKTTALVLVTLFLFFFISATTQGILCACVCVSSYCYLLILGLNFENLCNFLFFCYVANHQPGKHGNEISGIEMLAIEEELQDSTEDVAVMDYSPVQRKNPIHN